MKRDRITKIYNALKEPEAADYTIVNASRSTAATNWAPDPELWNCHLIRPNSRGTALERRFTTRQLKEHICNHPVTLVMLVYAINPETQEHLIFLASNTPGFGNSSDIAEIVEALDKLSDAEERLTIEELRDWLSAWEP